MEVARVACLALGYFFPQAGPVSVVSGLPAASWRGRGVSLWIWVFPQLAARAGRAGSGSAWSGLPSSSVSSCSSWCWAAAGAVTGWKRVREPGGWSHTLCSWEHQGLTEGPFF